MSAAIDVYEQDPAAPRSFLTDALIYGLGTVVAQGVSILLLPLYTRYLSPADFGVMEIIERIGAIINVCLMTGGISQAAMAFYLQSTSVLDRARVAVAVTFVLAICCLLGGAVTLALAPTLSAWLAIDRPGLFVFGVLSVLAQVSTLLPLTLMQARRESIAFATTSLAMSLVRIVLAIAFVGYWGMGLKGVYWSLLITSLGFGVVLTARELRRGSIGIDWQKCLAIVNFGLPFVPTGLLFFFLLNADRFFLLRSLGASELGLYALGAKLAGSVTLVSTAPLFKVWTASMYTTLARPGGSRQGGQMLQHMLVAYCFCGLGLCLFQKEVLALLSTSAYSRAAIVIAPLVAANGFMFAATFMECVFYVQRRTILKPLTALVGTIATVTLYATMIPQWGLAGAAYATLLGYATMAGITYVTAQRILHIRYNNVALLKLAAITVACYLPSTSLGLGVWQASAKLGLLAVWIVALRWTEIVTSQDVQRIVGARFRTAKA